MAPENAWYKLEQLRTKNKIIQNFPGWATILAAGQNVGGFGSLCEEFEMFNGTNFLIVGGPSQVYSYSAVTKLLTSIGVGFAPTRDEPWMAFSYKNEFYIVNVVDGMFKWNGTGSFVAVANAPKARSAEVLKDHICVLNTSGSPQNFAWCAENAPTVWTALTTNDAGSFLLDDSPDLGIALYPFGDDLIAYKGRTIIPITWIGGNEVFARRSAIEGVGLIGQYALVDLGSHHAFMGPDTFYRYAGTKDVDDEWGQRIWPAVYPRLHPTLKNRSRALFSELSREIIFAYPSSSAINDCDEAVVYNMDDDEWYGPFPIKCSMTGFSSKAATLFINDVTSIIDKTVGIIDSYGTLIGAPLDLFIDNNGDILQFGASDSANGVNITRTAESEDIFPGLGMMAEAGKVVNYPPETVLMVTAVNLFLRNSGVSSSTGKFYIGHRLELTDDIVWDGPISFNVGKGGLAKIPTRAVGRWFRIRIVIENSASIALTSYQYEVEALGRR